MTSARRDGARHETIGQAIYTAGGARRHPPLLVCASGQGADGTVTHGEDGATRRLGWYGLW